MNAAEKLQNDVEQELHWALAFLPKRLVYQSKKAWSRSTVM